ncbi:hypothetical protein [Methanothrix sp.]|uniref:hypothetical protein n=1 Tax=Methanothrix sp. TaxID=90426 RepID=UPI0025D8A012|nr:hypothetical protein [Methanothrix sp.]
MTRGKGDERAIRALQRQQERTFGIPFRHMVTAVQIARGDEEQLFVALRGPAMM